MPKLSALALAIFTTFCNPLIINTKYPNDSTPGLSTSSSFKTYVHLVCTCGELMFCSGGSFCNGESCIGGSLLEVTHTEESLHKHTSKFIDFFPIPKEGKHNEELENPPPF